MASEDIGNAGPRGLQLSIDSWYAYRRLGSPESELALAQAGLYLASVPKSKAVEVAFNAAKAYVRDNPSHAVPLRLRDALAALMDKLGHGKGYRDAHHEQAGYAARERYFPDEMPDVVFYKPTDRGIEGRIADCLAGLRERNGATPESAKSRAGPGERKNSRRQRRRLRVLRRGVDKRGSE